MVEPEGTVAAAEPDSPPSDETVPRVADGAASAGGFAFDWQPAHHRNQSSRTTRGPRAPPKKVRRNRDPLMRGSYGPDFGGSILSATPSRRIHQPLAGPPQFPGSTETNDMLADPSWSLSIAPHRSAGGFAYAMTPATLPRKKPCRERRSTSPQVFRQSRMPHLSRSSRPGCPSSFIGVHGVACHRADLNWVCQHSH